MKRSVLARLGLIGPSMNCVIQTASIAKGGCTFLSPPSEYFFEKLVSTPIFQNLGQFVNNLRKINCKTDFVT